MNVKTLSLALITAATLAACSPPTSPGQVGLVLTVNPVEGQQSSYDLGQACQDFLILRLSLTADLPVDVRSRFASASIRYQGKLEPMILAKDSSNFFFKQIEKPCANLFKSGTSELFEISVLDAQGTQIFSTSYVVIKGMGAG